ncbi:MAG: CaiB/BaiF CoA transferase family protein [Candidatus Dormibacterales bacterium]
MLESVRVLDLTRVLAGPFATMVLADLGAEVIKVEGPNAPDYTRSIAPLAGEMSHYFISANRGKKSCCIDLKSERGALLALDLVRRCDVVVENFRPGVMERLGLGYEALKAVRPDIVLCSVTGFGQAGPLARQASVDTVVQALAGVMSVNGEAEGPPLKLGLPIGDLAGAMWAAVGVLAALHRRQVTGRGAHVDVSLLDALVSQLSYLAELYLVTGESPARAGSRHHTVPAYGPYDVKDGRMVLAAQMDGFWRRFCEAAGRPELAVDPRFQTVPERRRHYAEVEEVVAGIMETKGVEEWRRLLQDADVPHAPILSVAEALESPHSRERGLVQEVEQLGAGKVRVLAPTLKFEDAPAPSELRGAPRLGEHTREVLTSVLGLSPGEVDALVADGVVLEARAEDLDRAPGGREGAPP